MPECFAQTPRIKPEFNNPNAESLRCGWAKHLDICIKMLMLRLSPKCFAPTTISVDKDFRIRAIDPNAESLRCCWAKHLDICIKVLMLRLSPKCFAPTGISVDKDCRLRARAPLSNNRTEQYLHVEMGIFLRFGFDRLLYN